MNKFILIQRYLPSTIFWPNMLNNIKVTGLTVEELMKKYQGFEGDLIGYFPIKKNDPELNEIIDLFSKEIKSTNSLMFYVHSDAVEEVPLPIKNQAKCVGYDVGVCDEEKTIFSSIFNEVLFGHLNELIAYKEHLNGDFLFSNKLIAEKYVGLHNLLSKEGKDVEDYEEMTIYELWKFREE